MRDEYQFSSPEVLVSLRRLPELMTMDIDCDAYTDFAQVIGSGRVGHIKQVWVMGGVYSRVLPAKWRSLGELGLGSGDVDMIVAGLEVADRFRNFPLGDYTPSEQEIRFFPDAMLVYGVNQYIHLLRLLQFGRIQSEPYFEGVLRGEVSNLLIEETEHGFQGWSLAKFQAVLFGGFIVARTGMELLLAQPDLSNTVALEVGAEMAKWGGLVAFTNALWKQFGPMFSKRAYRESQHEQKAKDKANDVSLYPIAGEAFDLRFIIGDKQLTALIQGMQVFLERHGSFRGW